MDATFLLRAARQLAVGPGALQRAGTLAADYGARQALLITDTRLASLPMHASLTESLRAQGIGTLFRSIDSGEPTVRGVSLLLDSLRCERYDLVVALGGGSVLDVAKLAAAAPLNPGLYACVADSACITRGSLPLIAIPTTAGTGAEATPNAILLDEQAKTKVGVIAPALIADSVILDPTLTTGLPRELTASTGLDALAHAVECYISRKATLLTAPYAVEAVRLVFRYLPQALSTPESLEARQAMQLAAYWAGVCIASSSTTAVHALAYPLSGLYHMSHGLSISMLLYPVLAFDRPHCAAQFAALARCIGEEGRDEHALADAFLQRLRALCEACAIPQSLRAFGVERSAVPSMAEDAMRIKRLFDNNPAPMNARDVEGIFEGFFD